MPEGVAEGGQLGIYVIGSVIGRGGMSVVYRAEHPRLGTTVALKLLAPELSADDTFRERFLREAKMAAGIDHPNVIPIYDTGLQGDSLYIVMRHVTGGDLKTLLRELGPLDPRRAIEVLLPVARALDAAHAHGLVHRDVKPANILLQRSPTGEVHHVYLTDFGVTKHAGSESGLTGTGAMVGTIDYMAPEQIEAQPVSSQTDVYALGCVLYQCLTGRVPFARKSDAAVLWAHVGEEVEPPSSVRPGLPPVLDAPIAKALAKAPADRYETCEQFIRACDAALSSPPPPPPAAAADLAGPRPAAIVTSAAPAPAATGSGGPPATAEAGRSDGGRGWLARHWWQVALLVAVVGGGIGAALALTSGSSSTSSSGSQPAAAGAIPATLKPVPTNRVTGRGRATVRLEGNVATVSITAAGLLNGAPHAMHIHTGGQGRCPPERAARFHNGHLAISNSDGAPFYGSGITSLTTTGDTTARSILAFTRYPSTGAITYTRAITLPATVAGLIRRGNAALVIHGIDYNGNGVYDSVLDRSELDPTNFGETTAPGLCGPLVPATGNAGASVGPGGGTRLYTASLTVQRDASGVWICRFT